MSREQSSYRPLALDGDLHEFGLTTPVVRPPQARQLLQSTASFLERGAEVESEEQFPVAAPQAIPEAVPAARFKVLQRWEGRVSEVFEDAFIASLLDTIDGETEEDAEFDLDDLSADDRKLVRPGALFYWSIGYRIEKSGETSRSSVIRFRRLPPWTSSDFSKVDEERQRLRTLIAGG